MDLNWTDPASLYCIICGPEPDRLGLPITVMKLNCSSQNHHVMPKFQID